MGGARVKAAVTVSVDAIAAKIGEAYEQGAASMRANVDTLTRALGAAHTRNGELEAAYLKALELVKAQAGVNAQLQVLEAETKVQLKHAENNLQIAGQAMTMLGPPIQALTSRFLPSAGAAAEEGEKTGRAAFLRLFGKLADDPTIIEALSGLAGPEDWALITAFASELAQRPQQKAAA
jgi:hypothetical protein